MIKFKNIPWFILVAVFFAIAGIPLAYFSGVVLAKIEHASLGKKHFQINPDDAKVFDKLLLSGAGLNVEIICGDALEIFQEVENDNQVFFTQRESELLNVYYQRLNTDFDNKIVISIPNRLFKVDVRNGARASIAECAVNPAHLTIDLAGGATLAASGSIIDLFLFAATGSQLIEGPQGFLKVEKAFVDLVINSHAELCGVNLITGSTSVGAKLKVSPNVIIDRMNDLSAIEYVCKEGLLNSESLPNA